MGNNLPMSKPIGIYEAKTHFSQIVNDLVNGRCGPVPIMRHGKQAVYLVTELPSPKLTQKPKIRFGIGKGRYQIVDDIDEANDEVLKLFAAEEA